MTPDSDINSKWRARTRKSLQMEAVGDHFSLFLFRSEACTVTAMVAAGVKVILLLFTSSSFFLLVIHALRSFRSLRLSVPQLA